MESMVLGKQIKNKFQILVDSDAFVGWAYQDDAHHKVVGEFFEYIKQNRLRMVTTSWVIGETATVLSHRKGQTIAIAFLRRIKAMNFPVIHVDEKLQQVALELFCQQKKKGTSMADCINVATMKQAGIAKIFSFDKAYSKQFGLEILTKQPA